MRSGCQREKRKRRSKGRSRSFAYGGNGREGNKSRVDGDSRKKKIEEGIEPRTSPDEGSDQSSEGQQKPQNKSNSKKRSGRLDHESLVRLCWNGECLTHRDSVSVDANNMNLEHLIKVCKPDTKIPLEIFGDLKRAYAFQREYDNSSSAEKAVHLLMRMKDTLKKMLYDSEYNAYWMEAEQWDRMGNAAALHILRMESLPRSRLEAADLLDTVKFPVTKGDHGGTIMEKYRAS